MKSVNSFHTDVLAVVIGLVDTNLNGNFTGDVDNSSSKLVFFWLVW